VRALLCRQVVAAMSFETKSRPDANSSAVSMLEALLASNGLRDQQLATNLARAEADGWFSKNLEVANIPG